MKSIAKLRDDARKHEQKEEWDKAIQAYVQVLDLGEQGDGSDLDLPLYNRVGDLYVRLGRSADAVTYYARAADRYAEAGLYNNAIALCNKALRYDANRLDVLRKLGSFSASQGFFTDARRWYLEYAEKSIRKGELDEAFAALSDLADVNDDPETRELLAVQLRDHNRKDRAVEEFKRAYALRVAAGEQTEAERIRSQIVQLDPAADISATREAPHHHAHAYEAEQLPGFMDKAPTPTPTRLPEPEPEIEAERPQATDDPIEIEQTAIEGGLELDANVGFETINIESGFAGADNADVETFDIGLEQSMGVTPEEALDESGMFELPTFDTEETVAETFEPPITLPGFDDPAAEPAVDIHTELPGLDELNTQIDADIQQDMPEFTGFGSLEAEAAVEEEPAEPLPAFDDGMGQGGDLDLTGGDFFTDLPALESEAEPEAAAELDFSADPETQPLPAFEADLAFEEEQVGAPAPASGDADLGLDLVTGFDEELATEFEAEPEEEFTGGMSLASEAEPDVLEDEEFAAPSDFERVPDFEHEEYVPRPPAGGSTTEAAAPATPEPEWLSEFEAPDAEAVEAEPEIEAEPEPEPAFEAAPPEDDSYQEAEAELEPEPTWEAAPEAQAEVEIEAETEPEPVIEPEPEPVVDAEPEAEPEPQPEPPVAAWEPEPPPLPPRQEKAAEPAPPRKDKEYVDLASFLDDDDEEEGAEDSTRFVVAEKPPTGDEEKDFADMLAQFKQKVAETIPKEDAGSHYDLGIAFKEMGLIDEAIGEFQTALRAGQEKLKVYEELGSCFVMKQQYSVAITVLNRASGLPYSDETELLGVYYNLGRAHEELGQRAEARSAYEKIVAIDIGFRDTTERISRL